MIQLVVALAVAAPSVVEKAPKPLPTLTKEPVVDGAVKDLAPAFELKLPKPGEGGTALTAKATFFRDSLLLGVVASDEAFNEHDALEVTVWFIDAGTTARGFVYRLGKTGLLPAMPEFGPPDFAQAAAKAAVVSDARTVTFELALPGRALPRFQAFKPLLVSVCLEYADVDVAGEEPRKTVSCPTGEMVGGPLRLPDTFRTALKLQPIPEVEGIEARPRGWMGFSKLHYPTWVVADTDFTPASLTEMVAPDDAIEPASVALPLPRRLVLADNRPVFTLLTGKNPYSKDACNPANELRLAMYVVKGNVAARVLEWPAATCTLGRAMKFELDPDSGQLVIGYTNGQTARFVWTAEHFERSELGALTPL